MTWQEQPPPERGGYDWPAILRKLRRRPEKWLLVAEQAPRSIQSAVRRGHISMIRDDPNWDYDIRCRRTNGQRADIWMSARRKERNRNDAASESGD